MKYNLKHFYSYCTTIEDLTAKKFFKELFETIHNLKKREIYLDYASTVYYVVILMICLIWKILITNT
jgi:hypothetical protein